MTTTEQHDAGSHTSSGGHVLAGAAWLDVHFEACRPEYEAMLRSAGIETGWRVLDAGCGGGSFLPLLAELVGPEGRIAALDAAPENVVTVRQRLAEWSLGCSVEPFAASLTDLPYADASFDAVWCANVTQYFDEDGLLHVLHELRRVVRPGGLVAVKDMDMQLTWFYPADPFLLTHLNEVSVHDPAGAVQSRGSIRGRELRRWLERAGMVDVRQRAELIERWAPLRPVERQLWVDWLAFLATLAGQRGVPEADLQTWRALLDPNAADHLVDREDFYCCEGQVLAVGRVPAVDERGAPDRSPALRERGASSGE